MRVRNVIVVSPGCSKEKQNVSEINLQEQKKGYHCKKCRINQVRGQVRPARNEIKSL